MKTVMITNHLSSIGGGENYLMRLAMALDKFSDFSIVENFHPDFEKYNGFGKQFKIFTRDFTPDVLISCSYNGNIPAFGDKSYVVVFFPKPHLNPKNLGYKNVISICDYTAEWVKQYWDMSSFVLNPCVDQNLYKIGKKEKLIVSIGHFFYERDGHSKNQHILIDAIKELPEYKLVLIGNAYPDNQGYLTALTSETALLKNVEIKLNISNEEKNEYLSRAQFLWHANGYGRYDPAQTEHFGIIVLEALASGCIPIVHRSGGAKDIQGAHTWNTVDELIKVTKELNEKKPIPLFKSVYTVEHFEQKVQSWLLSL